MTCRPTRPLGVMPGHAKYNVQQRMQATSCPPGFVCRTARRGPGHHNDRLGSDLKLCPYLVESRQSASGEVRAKADSMQLTRVAGSSLSALEQPIAKSGPGLLHAYRQPPVNKGLFIDRQLRRLQNNSVTRRLSSSRSALVGLSVFRKEDRSPVYRRMLVVRRLEITQDEV